MKRKILTILICGVMMLEITGCVPSEPTDEPKEISGISMTIKEGTLTNKGATVIIKDKHKRGQYVYGDDFRVDKKENGQWMKLENICDNCAFLAMAYYVDENGYLEFNCNWEFMYHPLEKGTYRIVKSTHVNITPVTAADERYFSVEFVIE